MGVDLAAVTRLQAMIEDDPAFLPTAWTSRELAYADGDVARLASRWAAKEAVMKALGIGIGRISPLDIEVLGDEDGVPSVALTGTARDRACELGIADWAISLSHEGGLAIAFAIASAPPPGQMKVLGGDDV
ncbi:holo-ACP synthase [Microbacterium sp.]|uniref:holo-ACP synthase n=1 Tax=Microbacterium sp. TaxID=51671 RepID=UPI003F6F81F1